MSRCACSPATHPFGAIARTVAPGDLAVAVRELTDDPEVHTRASAAATALAQERSWEHEMDGLQDLYRGLVAG